MFFFLTTLISTISAQAIWDYDENGPSVWATLPEFGACDGTRQSPIDIRSSNVENTHNVCSDQHHNFNWNFNFQHKLWKVGNVGASLKLEPVADTSGTKLSRGSTVSRFTNELFDDFKGTDPQQYCLDQVHFHVGRDSCEGSEHTLEGKSFPLEIHWVHSLCQYADIGEAIESGKEHALSVIGMFFQVSEEDNESLDTIINEQNINNLINGGSVFIQDNINMKELTPCPDGFCGLIKENFWFYDGSLTTPGCNEIVRWQVFEETQGVSKLQLQYLQRMQQRDGTQFGMTGTFRPPNGLTNNSPLNYVYEDCTA